MFPLNDLNDDCLIEVFSNLNSLLKTFGAKATYISINVQWFCKRFLPRDFLLQILKHCRHVETIQLCNVSLKSCNEAHYHDNNCINRMHLVIGGENVYIDPLLYTFFSKLKNKNITLKNMMERCCYIRILRNTTTTIEKPKNIREHCSLHRECLYNIFETIFE